uniref:Uncharacterized protein n=1 Tax=Brassica oleracea TaxID=3712 RepID=A0A3P6CNA9_BRAOL|nr:unnamed protein product [Brassica oleracea]
MPYVGGYDQSMCMGNNFQDPCLSNIQDYSVIPLDFYGLDQNMCMGDTTNSNTTSGIYSTISLAPTFLTKSLRFLAIYLIN